MTGKSAVVTVDNKTVELPVRSGSIGPDVVDIGTLYKQTGQFTYDPGFTSTAIVRDRRSPISMATRASCSIAVIRSSSSPSMATSSKPATCCSTANCRLQRRKGRFRLSCHAPHDGARADVATSISGFRRDAHPMAVMCRRRRRAVAPSITTRPTSHDPHQRDDRQPCGMIAKMPTLARDGLQVLDRPALRLSATMSLDYSIELPAHVLCRPLRRTIRSIRCWRVPWTASSSCTPITSRMPRHRPCVLPAHPAPIRSPVSLLVSPVFGVPHMAAPTKPRSTCSRNRLGPERIPEYIARAKDKNDPFRLMGFGHRVYKNYDPRAKIMQKTTHEVLVEALGHKDDPLLRSRDGAGAKSR